MPNNPCESSNPGFGKIRFIIIRSRRHLGITLYDVSSLEKESGDSAGSHGDTDSP